ncbi:MAG: DUF4328 domain-containing protein [Gammaproteobacteria bacterium]
MAESKHSGYRDLSRLVSFLKASLIAYIIIGIIGLWSSWQEIELLQRIASGGSITASEAMTNDNRQRAMAGLFILIFVITAIFFLRWVYLSNANARSLGAKGMQYTPGWSVGWYFVPVAHFWKPYQALKETFQASHPDYGDTDWRQASRPGVMPFWWTLWIIATIIGQILFRTTPSAETLNELLSSSWLLFWADALHIPLGIAVINLVTTLHEWQIQKYQRLEGHLQTNPSPICQSAPVHPVQKKSLAPENLVQKKSEAIQAHNSTYNVISEKAENIEKQNLSISTTDPWVTACRVFPDLEQQERALKKYSPELAAEFRNLLLESKEFKNSTEIFHQIETNFLEQTIGNPKLIKFAKSKIEQNNIDAFNSLRQSVSILGQDVEPDKIIAIINEDYPDDPKVRNSKILIRNYKENQSIESIIELAKILQIEISRDGWTTDVERWKVKTSKGWITYFDNDQKLLTWFENKILPQLQ